jgi:long-chain acyl-CoA synthetase
MDFRKFTTLHELFRNACDHIKSPDSPFMFKKGGGAFEPISFGYTREQANRISAWLHATGIKKGERAAVIIENSPEYVYFDQGLQQLGIINVSIYPTLTEAEIEYILKDSGARVILAGSPFLLKKILKAKQNIPGLIKIVTAFEDTTRQNDELVISLSQVFKKGAELYPENKAAIENEYRSIKHDDVASLIYTSGTTGIPKGVMLTHNNYISNAIAAEMTVPVINRNDRFLSFLPLCHVYERLATYYLGIYLGAEIAFAQSIETIAQNIGEVSPTIINTVPRLMEKIQQRVYKNAIAGGKMKAAIFKWAIAVGEKRRLLKDSGRSPGILLSAQLAVAEKLVFSKIKAKMGGRIKVIVSGGAALPVHVGQFFANIGLVVCEGYGLTETSPFISINEYEHQVWGTVGRIAPGTSVAIQKVDTSEMLAIQTYESHDPEFESGEGEILVKGHNVMKGYWNKPEETAKVIDREGWFHTGDIGRFYKGNLQITDRLKNMIVNSLGKNIYPGPVENVYLLSDKIDQIFIIGDRREYLTAIIYSSKEEMKSRFSLPESFFEEPEPFIHDQQVIDWLQEDVKFHSAKLAKFERIKDFLVKRRPFSPEEGEMTPTQKIKRKFVEEKYAVYIDGMYLEVES